MQIIGRAFIGIGLMISVLAGCCIDSPDPYGMMALIAVAVGGIVAGAGYGMMMVGKQDIKAFYSIHRKDRLDADVEFIELDKKIAP